LLGLVQEAVLKKEMLTPNPSRFNYSAAYSDYQSIEKDLNFFAAAASYDPRTSEDCLFLDVMVPKKIFDSKGNGKGAAVLVWIYGGGYTGGSKGDSGNPAGLIHASQSSGSDGVIYVSMNYRVSLNPREIRPSIC
jgi:cholinesterase